jgi:hypothetical protein
MKKTPIILFPIAILIAATSCKKPCYTCDVYIMAASRIDTFYTYGQVRYDTSEGFLSGGSKFTTCETNASYYYGNYTQPYFDAHKDTIIDCQQNNE